MGVLADMGINNQQKPVQSLVQYHHVLLITLYINVRFIVEQTWVVVKNELKTTYPASSKLVTVVDEAVELCFI